MHQLYDISEKQNYRVSKAISGWQGPSQAEMSLNRETSMYNNMCPCVFVQTHRIGGPKYEQQHKVLTLPHDDVSM